MVDVVAALPPADRQAAAEVADKHGEQAVEGEVARDGAVGGIVGREHDLVPEQTQEDGRRDEPLVAQGHHGHGKKRRVAGQLLAVLDVPALVVALIAHPLVQRPVLLDNVLLHLGAQRGEGRTVPLDFLAFGPGRVGSRIASEGFGRRVPAAGLNLADVLDQVRFFVDHRLRGVDGCRRGRR
jgi:hypothetical protein